MAKGSKTSLFEKVYRFTVRLISSDGFFYGIVSIAIIQALWYAFSFQPTINDEGRHLSNIFIYSNHWSPFLGNQPTSWDHLGEVTRDGSYMFYYVMSIPLRIARLFTHNQMDQIISLRVVCVAFVAAGIVLYRKALLAIAGVSKALVHLAFLFFILTPSFAILPGVVNYDNFVFFLFAILLLLTIRAINSNKLDIISLSLVAIVGMFMTVAKWSSFPLFLAVVIFLCADLYNKFGSKVFPLAFQSVKKLARWQLVLIVAGLLITTGLFIERPVLNQIKYGNPEPGCDKVVGATRCQAFRDYVIYSNLAKSRPAGFTPNDPVQYMLSIWEPRMADTTVNALEQGHSSEIPIVKLLFSFAGIAGVVLILLYARDFLKNKYFNLLFFISIVYLLFLAATEYQGYMHYSIPVAIRARYLQPILPIFFYFVALAFYKMVGKYKIVTLLSLCVVFLLLTQGGGIVTYSLTTPSRIYWRDSNTIKFDTDLQKVLHPFVIEHIGIGGV